MQLASYHAKASASATVGERYSKIKSNIEKSKAKEAIAEDEEMENADSEDEEDEEDEHSVLLYKDASDDQGGEIEEKQDDLLYGSEDDEDDYDEEIETIPMAKAKRQRQEPASEDMYGDEVEDGDDFAADLDDSVSSEDQRASKRKSKKKAKAKDEDKEPRGYDRESEDEDSDDEDVSEGALRKKLAADSDEENELQAGVDAENESDLMSDV